MAPAQSRKRKSDEIATPEAVTPTGSPTAKKMRITQSQKQALIDNLQLEVTERARRLRAQYAIQCKDLRSRIERRIHRIPIAMRNMTMAELMAKHEAIKKPAPTASKVEDRALPPPPSQAMMLHKSSPVRQPQHNTQLPRSRKRKSLEIHIASDKENEDEPSTNAPEALPISKNVKRAKTTTATSKTGRAASRTNKTRSSKEQAGILSPRSHNSRTLPRSPIKDSVVPMSPSKLPTTSFIARPISPLKPNSPLKSAAMATTSAISASVHGMIQRATQASKSTRTASKELASNTRAAKGTVRTASAQSNHSVDTQSSTTSTSTVVTKPTRNTTKIASTSTSTKMAPPSTTTRGKPTTTTTATSKAAGTAKTALKKAASVTTKKVVLAEPAAGRRVLRKRT